MEKATNNLTVGQRVADVVTYFVGSWKFLIALNLFILFWVLLNTFVIKIDSFPFTLLNLMLSWVAGVQAPLIMISQNRQEEIQKDALKTLLHLAESQRVILADHRKYLDQLKKHDKEMIEDLDEIKEQITHISE